MKSCGGIASVVAGGTKVWMRRNGHQGEMESSFRGGRPAHTCADCLHWAGTLHADAFQRSRWAHQIRIHVFTLDFSLPKCVHVCVCVFCALSWYVKTQSSVLTGNIYEFMLPPPNSVFFLCFQAIIIHLCMSVICLWLLGIWQAERPLQGSHIRPRSLFCL